jgi:hypothetical protein
MAYVFVVGLGLGLWMECKQQPRWFVDAVGESLQSISLPYVADVDLNWFPSDVNTCGGASSGQTLTSAAGNQIAIHFTTRRYNITSPRKLLPHDAAWFRVLIIILFCAALPIVSHLRIRRSFWWCRMRGMETRFQVTSIGMGC